MACSESGREREQSEPCRTWNAVIVRRTVAHELINPDGLPEPLSYTHVVIASGSRLVFIAGQVAEDADDNLVAPGDLAGQARQAFANLGLCLRAAGARPGDVTMLRIYVVSHRPEFLPLISEARIAVFGDYRPADTIVGVERLAEDGRLIEVEAVAVLPS
jgi:enamine deaminase RidA (YjgF/YER057c/UK114 family)